MTIPILCWLNANENAHCRCNSRPTANVMTQDGFLAVFCSFVLVVLSGALVTNSSSSSSSYCVIVVVNIILLSPYGIFQGYNEPIIQMEHNIVQNPNW